jgi:hypothetical protein
VSEKYNYKTYLKKENVIYAKIDELLAMGEDPKGKNVQKLFDELNELHIEEAGHIEKAFHSSLKMPIDAGRKAIERADRIIAKYEKLDKEEN